MVLLAAVLSGTAVGAQSLPCMAGAGEQVAYEGRTFAVGDRVQITGRGGTFKPVDSGHTEHVVAAKGKTGVLQCFAASPVTGQAQVGVVDWDAQEWQIWRNETGVSQDTIRLDVFSASIHLSYLRVIGK